MKLLFFSPTELLYAEHIGLIIKKIIDKVVTLQNSSIK